MDSEGQRLDLWVSLPGVSGLVVVGAVSMTEMVALLPTSQ